MAAASTYALPPASVEQSVIVNNVVTGGFNVIVDAVPGSGKTTAALHVALNWFDTQKDSMRMRPPGQPPIVIMTFNARLKISMRDQVRQLGLESVIDVHSFHSFGYKYYSKICINDDGMSRIVDKDNNYPGLCALYYDLIIIDEAQDVRPLIHAFICKVILKVQCDRNTIPMGCLERQLQLLVMGDIYQAVYKYDGADSRYLTLADRCFPTLKTSWVWVIGFRIIEVVRGINNIFYDCSVWVFIAQRPLSLSISYRLTANMALFINEVVLRLPSTSPRIISHDINNTAHSPRVQYYVGNQHKNAELIFKILNAGIKNGEYTSEDIFLLAPSVKNSANRTRLKPVSLLSNLLSEAGHQRIYLKEDEAGAPNVEVMRGKIAVTTFHQAKGLERKVVVCFGFDKSYNTYYGNGAPLKVCPDPAYVAESRSTWLLFIIAEEQSHGYLPCIDHARLDQLYHEHKIDVLIGPDYVIQDPLDQANVEGEQDLLLDGRLVQATSLCGHLPISVLSDVVALLDVKVIFGPHEPIIKLPMDVSILNGNGGAPGLEPVCNLNGLAIPAMLEAYDKEKLAASMSTITDLPVDYQCTMFDELSRHCRSLTGSDRVISNAFNSWKEVRANSSALGMRTSTAEFLRLSTIYQCLVSGYHHLLTQIPPNASPDHYDWLDRDLVEMALTRLRTHVSVPAETQYEVLFQREIMTENRGMVLVEGLFDVMTKDHVLELKCTAQPDASHLSQLLVYAWLYLNELDSSEYVDFRNAFSSGERKSETKKKMSAAVRHLQEVRAELDDDLAEISNTTSTSLPCISSQPSSSMQMDPVASPTLSRPKRRFRLLYVCTGELREITDSPDKINKAMRILIEHYSRSEQTQTSDDAFVTQVGKCWQHSPVLCVPASTDGIENCAVTESNNIIETTMESNLIAPDSSQKSLLSKRSSTLMS